MQPEPSPSPVSPILHPVPELLIVLKVLIAVQFVHDVVNVARTEGVFTNT